MAAKKRTRSAGKKKPRGREEVRSALIRAGAELFASRGLSAVSVRDVAERAGVNHGLVHHYFGSKDDLLREVVHELAEELLQKTSMAFDELFETSGRTGLFRIMARLILDGYDPKRFVMKHPLFERIHSFAVQAKEAGFLREDLDPRLVTAMGIAMHLGWMVFEPHLLDSAGYSKKDRKALQREVFQTYMRLILSERDALGFGRWMTPSPPH